VDAAALPGGVHQLGDGRLNALMGVEDHQLPLKRVGNPGVLTLFCSAVHALALAFRGSWVAVQIFSLTTRGS
jgi:hypothetical protein